MSGFALPRMSMRLLLRTCICVFQSAQTSLLRASGPNPNPNPHPDPDPHPHQAVEDAESKLKLEQELAAAQQQVEALGSIRGRTDAAQRVQRAEATSSAAEKQVASLKATLLRVQGERNRAVKAAEAAKAATRTAKATAQSLVGQLEEQAAEEQPAPGTSEAQQAASGGASLYLCSVPSSLGGSSPLSASPRRGLALRAAEEDEGERRQVLALADRRAHPRAARRRRASLGDPERDRRFRASDAARRRGEGADGALLPSSAACAVRRGRDARGIPGR